MYLTRRWMNTSNPFSRSTSQGLSSMSPFQKMMKDVSPGLLDRSGHLPPLMTRFLTQWGSQPTSGSRFLSTAPPVCSEKSTFLGPMAWQGRGLYAHGPSSPNLTTSVACYEVTTAPRRATTTRYRGTAWATWTAAGAVAKPHERDLSSHRLIVWRRRCGLGAFRLRYITASSAGVARQSGRPKGWGRSSFPM